MTATMDDQPSLITRLLTWLWRDGPIWIVVGSIAFLAVVLLLRAGGDR
ncbi:MAG: hypothetical protein Q8L55_03505 [Phycisphaerales bacterium]|nr:hypothetical protein [Phycisphaerales bacterium]